MSTEISQGSLCKLLFHADKPIAARKGIKHTLFIHSKHNSMFAFASIQ